MKFVLLFSSFSIGVGVATAIMAAAGVRPNVPLIVGMLIAWALGYWARGQV